MKNFKIKETYLLFLIVMGLVSIAIYSTYALFTTSTEITNVVNFHATLTTDSNILEYEMVTIPSGENKIIELNITNSYSQTLYYGAWYQIVSPTEDTSSVNIGLYTEKNNTPSSGTIEASSTKNLLVGISNYGEFDAIVNVGTVGSLTESLGLTENRNLLEAGWEPYVPPNIIIESIPEQSGFYTVNTSSCSDASMTYDYVLRGFKITNTSIPINATCVPTVTTTSRTRFNDYVISLLGSNTSVLSESTTGNGSTLEKINSTSPTGTSTDYRYRGVNPANYVMFNDELWRIIGVFDENSHRISGTNLVKIIRNNSFGASVRDYNTSVTNSGSNDYANSDLYNLLNKAYYNNTSSTAAPIDATGQDYCYLQSSENGKCDYTGTGIQVNYKDMVEDGATWYLGGVSSIDSTASTTYTSERTSTTVADNNVFSVVSPIGLMYISDYGYAAPSACNNTNMNNFNSNNSTLTKPCAVYDWLKVNGHEWTIGHLGSNSYQAIRINGTGEISTSNATFGNLFRPVLYLDANVYYLSGNGTQSNPYIVALS